MSKAKGGPDMMRERRNAMTHPVSTPAFAGFLPGRAPPKKPRRTGLTGTGSGSAEPATISEINTTPLIDVMLVLLIMFIITIPVASHKVPLDLPQPSPVTVPERPFHVLDIRADGSLAWNGAALPADQLQAHLQQLAANPATPELRLNADSATRYERVDQVLAQIRLAGVQRLGFIGNERYAQVF
jgi:biopolymer transport protein ExbD